MDEKINFWFLAVSQNETTSAPPSRHYIYWRNINRSKLFSIKKFSKIFPNLFSHLYCTVCRDESRRPIGAWEIADEIILPPMPPRTFVKSHLWSTFFFLSLFRLLKKIKRDGLEKFRFLKQNWLESSVYIG